MGFLPNTQSEKDRNKEEQSVFISSFRRNNNDTQNVFMKVGSMRPIIGGNGWRTYCMSHQYEPTSP